MDAVDLDAASRHLRLAAQAVGLSLPSAKVCPDVFAGPVTIAWPERQPGDVPLQGWRCRLFDEGGRQILTVTDIIVHATPENFVWAELTMFAGEDGRPVLHIPRDPDRPGADDLTGILGEDGEPRTATFPFLVMGMVTGTPEAVGEALAAAG